MAATGDQPFSTTLHTRTGFVRLMDQRRMGAHPPEGRSATTPHWIASLQRRLLAAPGVRMGAHRARWGRLAADIAP